MKKAVVLILSIVLITLKVQAQQDAQFTQYIFNGLYINPAYAGYKEDIYVQSYFRSQWVGLTGAPMGFAIAVDGTLNDHVGLGAMINKDQIGAQSALSGYLNYAYRIRVSQDESAHLAFGLAAGMMQLGIDGSKLNAVTPGDQSVPIASQNIVLPDANFGIYYADSRYFAGISATNIVARFIRPNGDPNSLVPIPQPHFYLTSGTLIPINDDIRIKPIMLIKDDFKGPTTLDIDGFVIFSDKFTLGGFYRSSVNLYRKNNLQRDLPKQNSFGFIADFFINSNIRVGYSYDHSMNAFSAFNSGSHELSLGFYLNSKSSRGHDSAFRCFKF